MYRKDYILRMIEMFGEVIAAILGLIRKKDFTQASDAMENAYTDFLQKEAAFFRVIPKEQLTHTLIQEHNYTHNHLEILAYLFYAEAEINHTQGKKKECLLYSEKALLLFEFVDNESKTYSDDRNIKINQLKNWITDLTI